MRKTHFLIIFLFTATLFATACSFIPKDRKQQNETEKEKLSIAVSVYPYAQFAQAVGKDRATVTIFNPLAADAPDVFLYDGSNAATEAERFAETMRGNGALVKKIPPEVSDYPASEGYLWLDPISAQHIVDIIRDILINHDPKNKSAYEENAALYNEKLEALNRDIFQGLAECKTRTARVLENNFGYFEKRYGISFLVTEDEKERLALYSLVSLTPEQKTRKQDYLSVMRENLAILQKELGCTQVVPLDSPEK